MGDRVYCCLTSPVPFSPELLALIEEEGPDLNNDRTENSVWFDEVKYGEMPEALRHHLLETKTPFAWAYEAGGGFGAGVWLFDGTAQAEYSVLNGDLMVSVRIFSAEVQEEACKWQKFWDSCGQ